MKKKIFLRRIFIYQFSAPNAPYIPGASEHKGLSELTRKPLSRAKQSDIRVFIMTCGSEILIDAFHFIATSSKEMESVD